MGCSVYLQHYFFPSSAYVGEILPSFVFSCSTHTYFTHDRCFPEYCLVFIIIVLPSAVLSWVFNVSSYKKKKKQPHKYQFQNCNSICQRLWLTSVTEWLQTVDVLLSSCYNQQWFHLTKANRKITSLRFWQFPWAVLKQDWATVDYIHVWLEYLYMKSLPVYI